MYSKRSAGGSSMAFSRWRKNSPIDRSSSAPRESTASRGAKRPSSLRMWLTASLSKAAQQNSPVDTSQKAAPPLVPFRATAQM